ncbi:lipoprotein-releasing system ATP-binding protein LolD [mine drainage metagenome]|uniref:Lipoprotein-releasing system ATP-binding protein LolD n=1 Tax=mine drainage metagenome TaxID=410659 RepID=A0A1J5RLD4_9ZZZZ
MLRAENIHKKYGQLQVLKGVNVTIEQKEIVSIIGSSGAGKSTLLHILGTLDTPDEGKIFLNDEPLHLLKGKKLATFRNKHIGFVFQFHHLLPEFSAAENVSIPGWIAGRKKKEVNTEAIRLLELLGLKEKINNKPQELSGGEQQRVAVARALINRPSIVFADEPTGNLDSTNAKELHELFVRLRNEFDQTFLIVTHNEELAALSDRTLHMKDGLILPTTPKEE